MGVQSLLSHRYFINDLHVEHFYKKRHHPITLKVLIALRVEWSPLERFIFYRKRS